MITLHGDSLKIKATASKSFPRGFWITEFADEGAESICPLTISAAEYVAVHLKNESEAAANLRAISHMEDDIGFNVTFPDGRTLELKNGFITGQMQLPGDETAFFFTFRDQSAAQKSVSRKEKRKVKTLAVPAGTTVH